MGVENLFTMINEGRVIRRKWTDTDSAGRELACLLAAISPEVAETSDPARCPATIMPAWLAYLTPWMDDCGSDAAWPGMIRRYADLAARWHVLTDEKWSRLELTAKRIIVESVIPYAGKSEPAVTAVLTLLRRAESGDRAPCEEWEAAQVRAAAEAAQAETQVQAAWAVTWAEAAWAAAAWAAAEVGAQAAWAVTWAAAWAVRAVRAAAEAEAVRAGRAAAEAITTAILDAIEAAIVLREQQLAGA
jgi:hypothetical protein